MKLRNKKTGKIIEGLISAYGISGDVAVSVMDHNAESGYTDLGRYETLAELNEDWEDYNPAEPLIKDEKVRNLVREWIKLWETGDRWYVCDNKSGEISIARSDIELILPLSYGIEDGYYTIAELCGEEEE